MPGHGFEGNRLFHFAYSFERTPSPHLVWFGFIRVVAQVQFKFFMDSEAHKTQICPYKTINPTFEDAFHIEQVRQSTVDARCDRRAQYLLIVHSP